MDSDSDEDLKKAIALSLEASKRAPSRAVQAVGPVPLSSGSDELDDDDDDLKAAIALSLMEEPKRNFSGSKSSPTTIDITSDEEDDDDDLDAPFRNRDSKVPQAPPKHESDESGPKPFLNMPVLAALPPPNPTREIMKLATNIKPSMTPSSSAPSGLGRLNRKQMEEERLARINQKRKLSNEPEDRNRMRRQKLSSNICQLDGTSQATSVASSLEFPDGVIKKTWVHGYARTGDDIKIEEVIQKANLELAVLSAFQIDTDWITSKLKEDTKVVWVLQAKTEPEKQNWRSQAPTNYKFCFPSMEGNINCMHSKLMLCAYSTHLRIVVPSANLTPYDWGETGVMENVCFLIDLPRLAEKAKIEELTGFGKELIYFTEALGIDKGIVDSIRRFDFSRTKNLAFVHSIGGSHIGNEMKRTGYCGLSTAVQSLGLHTASRINVDFLASSIGSLKESFLEKIYMAAQGSESEQTGNATQKKLAPGDKQGTSAVLQNYFRIYFPSHDTVAKSKGGIGAGGTICLTEKFYNQPTFPRYLLRDCKSQRAGLLMHDKMMFVRGPPNKSWVYIGSHNLSESAWGLVTTDRKTKKLKLGLRNWECGIVFPVDCTGRSEGRIQATQTSDQGAPGWDVFQGRVPVPMLVPNNDVGSSGLEYGDRKPWFFN